MSSCKDCKFWESVSYCRRTRDKGPQVYHLGVCHAPINIDEEGLEDMIPDGLGLDYPVCAMVTGPLFGCVKFAAKDGLYD